MKKNMIMAFLTVSVLSIAALAQGFPPGGGSQRCLQNATNAEILNELNRRLSNVPPVNPPPVSSAGFSCLIVDSGYKKTFLGKGSTALEAEAKARQECGKSVNSSYCNSGVKCAQPVPGSQGSFCLVVDTGYNKTFSSAGTDAIDAEAKAKIACQTAVNSAYCGDAVAKCEAQY